MKRLLYNKLIEWKKSPDRKPLILEGARQVGKTWLLQEFGRSEYESVAYVNFHNSPDLEDLFIDFDIDRILRAIAAICNVPIHEERTLIILDEVQEVDNGLASLKYFCENKPDIHIAVAGSLLGLAGRRGESFPVGKVDFLRLQPMNFAEFLAALGKDQLLKLLKTLDWDALNLLDNNLTDLLRQYYYVGGMPEAVKKYVETGDIHQVRKIQKAILRAYDRDFAKHSGSEAQRIRMVWDSIPAQLAKENKKFIFGAVKKGARAATFEVALQWLKDAGLIHRVERCSQPVKPLKFYANHDAFKVYVLDVGLFGAMSDTSPADMLVKGNVFTEFKGAFTENYVLQQLLVDNDYPIYYFSKDNSSQEVDFLVQTDERIIPIEVKAEENVKSKSLTTFINVDHKEKALKAMRFSMLPYKDQVWMENIPLWAVGAVLHA